MTVTRNYNSPLREEQMEQTRERILEAMEQLLADESAAEISVAVVAEHARISTRTAYRYFPTKEALLDAFNLWMRKRFGSPQIPSSLDEVQDNCAQLIRYFEANENMMRASRSMPHRELRKRRKIEQVKGLTQLAVESAPHLDPTAARLRIAAIHHLIGSDCWLNLRDNWGFTADETIEAIQWALKALSEQFRADEKQAAKKRK